MKIRISVVLVMAVAIQGCITVGSDFNSQNVKKIKIGETTAFEVYNLFGRPYREGWENGDPTWTYVYYKYSPFGKTTYTKDLNIKFKNGVVSYYTYNNNWPSDSESK